MLPITGNEERLMVYTVVKQDSLQNYFGQEAETKSVCVISKKCLCLHSTWPYYGEVSGQ